MCKFFVSFIFFLQALSLIASDPSTSQKSALTFNGVPVKILSQNTKTNKLEEVSESVNLQVLSFIESNFDSNLITPENTRSIDALLTPVKLIVAINYPCGRFRAVRFDISNQ